MGALTPDDLKQGKFWGVQLVKSFYTQMIASSMIQNDDMDPWTLGVFEKCLDASLEVLSVVVEVGESNVEQRRNPHPQLPLGVPAPFNNRNDLNRLLNGHRTSQKRRKLMTDEALKARQVAYEMITSLAARSLARSQRPFELAIFLLRCAVYEDELMQHYAANALDALLKEYIQAFGTKTWDSLVGQTNQTNSLQQQATPLLPSLLDAVCSDSVTARSAASKWISRLLQRLDSQAAQYLSSYLVNDTEKDIVRIAQSVIDNCHEDDVHSETRRTTAVFLDLSEETGLLRVETSLKDRTMELSERLEMPLEYAEALLVEYSFSLEAAQKAYETSASETLTRCGLRALSDSVEDEIESSGVCEICYEELGDEDHPHQSLQCGHVFCRDCWFTFFETASGEGAFKFLNTRCPRHDCNSRVLSRHVATIVPSLYPKWTRAFLDSFIDFDPAYRFCPGPDCRFVAYLDINNQCQQTSTCGHCTTSFCFQCGESPHQPAKCEDFASWNKLKGSSNFWIKKNANPCPGCNSPIEKNMGCNHMTCENCRTQFCWLFRCLSAYCWAVFISAGFG